MTFVYFGECIPMAGVGKERDKIGIALTYHCTWMFLASLMSVCVYHSSPA